MLHIIGIEKENKIISLRFTENDELYGFLLALIDYYITRERKEGIFFTILNILDIYITLDYGFDKFPCLKIGTETNIKDKWKSLVQWYEEYSKVDLNKHFVRIQISKDIFKVYNIEKDRMVSFIFGYRRFYALGL